MSPGGRFEFEIGFGPKDDRPQFRGGGAFRIAVLGDSSASAHRPSARVDGRLAERRVHGVDRDDLDGVLARLAPELELDLLGEGGTPVPFKFERLDDFHPDRLFVDSAWFRALRRTRERIEDPATFQEAVQEVDALAAQPASAADGEAAVRESDASREVVSELLADRETTIRKREAAVGVDIAALVASVVKRHVRPDTEQDQQRYLSSIDEAISEQMRLVLHQPSFKELEALWRGVDLLVRRLDTDGQLQLSIIDVSKEELAQDLASAESLESSDTYKLLVDRTVGTAGGRPWALLVGGYAFGGTREDADLLGSLADVAREAGAPFVAAETPALFGCKSLAKTADPDSWTRAIDDAARAAWEALRRKPSAHWVSLVVPRMLLRLPYGKKAQPTHAFDFEEVGDKPRHQEYLWGSGAFGCACLLGQAFSEDGWSFDPAEHRELTEMPAHVYTDVGERVMKPFTEAWLSDRAIRAMLARGLSPLAGIKHSTTARLVVLLSVAEPPTRLSGRWRGAS